MSDRKPLHSFWGPRYWPTWAGLAFLRLICLLPHRLALGIGKWLGRLAHRAAGTRRAIVRRNIELCFPDLSVARRDDMAQRHFEALGMSLIEIGLARWATDRTHLKIGRLEGYEHIERAIDGGQGRNPAERPFHDARDHRVAHLALRIPAVRRGLPQEPQRVHDRVATNSGREQSRPKRHDREARHQEAWYAACAIVAPVWYAPDQSYNAQGRRVILPFFGGTEPCTRQRRHRSRASVKAVVDAVLPAPARPTATYEFTRSTATARELPRATTRRRTRRTLHASCSRSTYPQMPGAVLLGASQIQEPAGTSYPDYYSPTWTHRSSLRAAASQLASYGN